MIRKCFLLFTFCIFATAAFTQKVPQGPVGKQKLVVGLVVDQMRWDYLYRYKEVYGEGGFKRLLKAAPDHFKMIFDKLGANATQQEVNHYSSLPGLAMLVAGIWVANLNYWGCNQYITQRALGADLKTARTGILFAAFLILMMPVLVVLPGIVAYVLHQNGELQQQMLTNGEFREDNTYSAVLGFLPTGLRGLSMAALTAAIVASLAGKANSISTIYTLDIYKKYIKKDAAEKKLVWMGSAVVIASLIIAIIVNWQDTLGIGGKGGFEFIQKYTGYISPAIFPVFLLGFFWKKATSRAAITGIIGGVLLAILFDKFLPGIAGNDTLLYTAYRTSAGIYEIPFLIQMGWVFFFTSVLIITVSLIDKQGRAHLHALEVDKGMFKVTKGVMAMNIILLILIAALYIRFW